MPQSPPPPRRLLRPPPLVAALAFVKLALLLHVASAYGYHPDELYGLSCARRLAWGYVDQAPASVALMWAAFRIYGETLLSMRVIPAVLGTLVVILTARLAARFGAGMTGQVLAALAVVVAPGLLSVDHICSARSVAVLVWTIAMGFAVQGLRETGSRPWRPWVMLGVSVGVGLLDAPDLAVLGGGLAVGLLVSPCRRLLYTSRPWIAALGCGIVLAPHLVWQMGHGWPVVAAALRAAHMPLERGAPLAFVEAQVERMLPPSALFWMVGLWALVGMKELAPYRPIGVGFLLAFLTFALTSGHDAGVLLPGYPVLVAAGAATIEGRLGTRRWLAPAVGLILAGTGALVAPTAIPLLPVAKAERYMQAVPFGFKPARDHGSEQLPRQFADTFGWPELVRTVSEVTGALADDDRAVAVVLAHGTAQAAALDVLGPAVGLPSVISGAGAFATWGTGGASGNVVVAVGGDAESLRRHWRNVDVVSIFGHSLAGPDRRRVRIYLCRDPVAPLDAMWSELKELP